MSKKYNKRQILKYITDYLIQTLNEITQHKDLSEYTSGEFWAYIECLEILSRWTGFKNYDIPDIEEHFAVN